jgi:hypothetical protein
VSSFHASSLLKPSTLSLDKLREEVGWPQEGLKVFFGICIALRALSYYMSSLALYAFPPGEVVEDTELACKGRLRYEFNGINLELWFAWYQLTKSYHFLPPFWYFGAGFLLWTYFWDDYLQIITVNLLICTGIAVFVYAKIFLSLRLVNSTPAEKNWHQVVTLKMLYMTSSLAANRILRWSYPFFLLARHHERLISIYGARWGWDCLDRLYWACPTLLANVGRTAISPTLSYSAPYFKPSILWIGCLWSQRY